MRRGYNHSCALTTCLVLFLTYVAITPVRVDADGLYGTGVIHVCIAKDGTLRVIAATATCKTTETASHWFDYARSYILENYTNSQIPSLQTQINTQAAQISSLQNQISAQASQIATLEIMPTAITAYTNRQAFIGAAGTTTNDFSQLGDDQQNHKSLTISGVTFYNFEAYSYPGSINLIIVPGALKVDLPPNTRAVGDNFASAYGDPGIGIMSLPTGHEFVSTWEVNSDGGFVGVVSDKPIPWVKFRYHSSCVPTQIYGTATCPTFPSGSPLGLATYDDFVFGPGSGN